MDLSHPLRTVVPTLDAFVLEVLAGTSRPLSARQISRLVNRGSLSGVRLVLQRLVAHGLALLDDREVATFYVANREHLAWPSILGLLSLNGALESRIQDLVSTWAIPPVTLALFGSGARRDGSLESDIDLLLIEPAEHGSPEAWDDQRETLAGAVERWTGNRAHIYDLDGAMLKAHIEADEPIVDEWRADARTLVGRDLSKILRRRTDR